MGKVRISFEMTVQRASIQVCAHASRPLGTIEVLDADGDRYFFAESEAEAYREIKDIMAEGFAVSSLDIEIAEIDSSGGSSVVG